MKTVKGMIQVAGATYRIVRVEAHRYEVVRILDDTRVGSFFLGSRLEVTAGALGAPEVRDIAQVAIRNAKTSWVGDLRAPVNPCTRQLDDSRIASGARAHAQW